MVAPAYFDPQYQMRPVVILHATVVIHPLVVVQFAWQLQDQANGDDFV